MPTVFIVEVVLAFLLFLFQIGLPVLDLQERFLFGLGVWVTFLLLGAHLIWTVLSTKTFNAGLQWKISTILLFAAIVNLFVYPGLERRYKQERAERLAPAPTRSTTQPPNQLSHAELNAEDAPGQALVQVKNTGARATFCATAKVTSVVESPPTDNRPFLHSYPLRWIVNNQNDLSIEGGAPGQLLIASTHQVPTKPQEERLYELILEGYQGGTPIRPGTFRWNGSEPNGAVRVFLEVIVSSPGHGAISDHFVISSLKWGGIKIERGRASATAPQASPPARQQPPATGPSHLSAAAPLGSELHRQREEARGRYLAFVLAVPTAAEDNIEAITSFRDNMLQAQDLFGENFYLYINQIYQKAIELRAIREGKRNASRYGVPQEEITRLACTENELVAWFTAQYGELRARLALYFNRA